jgi:hypothetical protein
MGAVGEALRTFPAVLFVGQLKTLPVRLTLPSDEDDRSLDRSNMAIGSCF